MVMNRSRLVVIFGGSLALIAGTAWFWRSTARTPTLRPAAESLPATVAPVPATAAVPRAGPVAGSASDANEDGRGNGAAASATHILARIAGLKVSANQPKSIRQLLVELEQLKQLGPAALPALREFLARGTDADYDAATGRAGFKDGKVPVDFVIPPSLRLALLEVAKDIGGADAEELLSRELKTTGRGVEAAYIAAALEQLSPGKYRAEAAAAARDLLAMPLSSAAKSALDRSDRDCLYNILASAGDASQVTQAKAQIFLPDGQVDRGALRYLQQMLGEEAVAVAVAAWDDPRVPTQQKEPLARLALAFVGRNPDAEQLYQRAIDDPKLSPGARKNLIEDLNQDGFANLKQLSAADLPLIEKRLALIDRLAPRATDPVNVAAFAEARKDLVQMQAAAQRPKPPKR